MWTLDFLQRGQKICYWEKKNEHHHSHNAAAYSLGTFWEGRNYGLELLSLLLRPAGCSRKFQTNSHAFALAIPVGSQYIKLLSLLLSPAGCSGQFQTNSHAFALANPVGSQYIKNKQERHLLATRKGYGCIGRWELRVVSLAYKVHI